ncbi:membrane protein [Nocardia neocaledoniensis NBRC 108232]|uniref:Putative superfamily III holin-X n=1 Tax=Nocardia neocaledoniensis TaxID=236511 RepID=A0A317NQ85_9NOCA|nr:MULTISPECIES: phage holin family protein [Nocardia]PWV76654.1 putative superfamily III holin-X [Nocardia neocaledoniensis]UGT52927.1 phage holin family protein [Nocardia asteroides]GEM34596.1 membrane protein [Nocardia neocaledoniensis NBRC 108232]
MSYTQGGNDGRTVTSIPLTDANPPGSASIGSLVRDATEQMSTLVRAEVALAKAEVTAEVRKGLTGSVFFILALTVLLFSSFFFFFFLAELLDVWLYRWAAFLIVFALMVLTTALLALLGWLKVRKLRAPEKTIGSLKQTAEVLPAALTHRESTAPALEKSTNR